MTVHTPPIKPPIIAFPRNYLHVQLLEENLPNVDYIIYRENFMRPRLDKGFAPEKLIPIGREMRPGLNGWNIPKIIKHNRQYYPKTLAELAALNPETFIIFLENEPLEVAMMDYFSIEHFELWEEGVMHYIDMFNPVFFRARRLAQIGLGFYGRHPLRTRVPRSSLVVRDRFDKENLRTAKPQGVGMPRNAIAFIANVMVNDGLIGQDKYIEKLSHLVETSPIPIEYLPHPREDRAFVRHIDETLASPRFRVVIPEQGTLQYCVDYDFRAYLSPFSTTLLDLQKFDKSFWMPQTFDLKSYEKALRHTSLFPVKLLNNSDLEAMLADLQRPPSD